MNPTVVSIAIIGLSVLGLLIASYIHRKKTRKEGLVCPMKAHCDTVITSAYSQFFGIPVELLGISYYGLMAIGYGGVLALNISDTWVAYALLGASFGAMLFSVYLTFVQILSLKQFCSWCLTSAALSVGIFVLAFLGSASVVVPFLGTQAAWITVLHLFGMALGLGSATVADILFLKFLKDYQITERESEVLHTMSQVLWFALGLVVISGVGLYLPATEALHASTTFLMKMIVLAVIIVNGAFLNLVIAPKLVRISFGKKHAHHGAELRRARHLVFALGPISFVSWYVAFFLGAAPLPSAPLITWVLGYLSLLLIGIGVGQYLDYNVLQRIGTAKQRH